MTEHDRHRHEVDAPAVGARRRRRTTTPADDRACGWEVWAIWVDHRREGAGPTVDAALPEAASGPRLEDRRTRPGAHPSPRARAARPGGRTSARSGSTTRAPATM